MKKRTFGEVIIVIVLILQTILASVLTYADTNVGEGKSAVTASQEKAIEDYIQKVMKAEKIPGISLAIVNGTSEAYIKGFGFSNIKSQKPVTADTLFEISSNSKAFTALGIFQLEDKGTIHLNDSVDKYIPWLKMNYNEKSASVTVEQLLHHTGGIKFSTIAGIPEDDGDDALENAVRTLEGKTLGYDPGTKFLYTTIDYDILGFIIQKVSGQLFEDYMKDNILKPLGLDHTFLYRKEAGLDHMATGYKIAFGRWKDYNAPLYRGNTPAGYFISNGNDMARWMKIQLGTIELPGFERKLIEKSKVPNPAIKPLSNGLQYASGWFVKSQDEIEILHPGSNPNFSSAVILKPSEKLGVTIMVNANISNIVDIGNGISDIVLDKTPKELGRDIYAVADIIITILVCITLLTIILMLSLIYRIIINKKQGKRSFQWGSRKRIIKLIVSIIILAAFYYFIVCFVPFVLLDGLSWNFIMVWGPGSLKVAAVCVLLCAFSIYIHCLTRNFLKKSSTYEKLKVGQV